MHPQTDLQANRRRFFARLLLICTGLLFALHILIVTLPTPNELASNIFQLIFPLLVVGVALQQRASHSGKLTQRCWTAIAVAFGIWSAAQMLYIYFIDHPVRHWGPLRWDDALWLLFGFPLLVALNSTQDKMDRVGRLDRAQAVLFCVVLYCLAFVHAAKFSVQLAYLIQNVALMLCCLLRLPESREPRERRFFTHLFVFLLSYGCLETVGEQMYNHGFRAGSFVDLTWTAPIVLYLTLLLLEDLGSKQEEPSMRWSKALENAQGLGIAALTLLAVGASIFLATQWPVAGGLFVVAAFGIFALRTSFREHSWHLAHTQLNETVLKDSLTGLGNRAMLRQRLDHQLQAPDVACSVLIYIDLDRFKHINDSLGHALGDELLVQIGDRLRRTAPPRSTVCRHGGDEFVVLSTARHAEEARAIGESLLQAMRPAYHLGPHTLVCTASVGVVLAIAGETSKDLLRSADHAMYRAKQLGKDCVQLFDSELREEISDRWRLEADLRLTVEQGAIEVAFQPILRIESGQIGGFESLARWTHAVHGPIAPGRFIPLAEDSGLILQLGEQVLLKACTQVAQWNAAWGTEYFVSVNVSPRQFTDASLVTRLLEMLDSSGLERRLLHLEITESALLVNQHRVKAVLDTIRSYGIRISLDDFGTGYSSLSFLLSLPVDEVKVDRSFVSQMHLDPKRRELVRTVVQLGLTLGKCVVAEGVETEQELLALTLMGCECAQGYFIGRPLSAELTALALRGSPTVPQPVSTDALGNQLALASVP